MMNQTAKKILVTGGAGYIGSHVVKQLVNDGHNVTVYDNLTTGSKDNLVNGCEFIEGDILDSSKLNQTMASGFDIVFHFAALKSAADSMIHPEHYARNNITGSINLLEEMNKNNIRYFIFSSSAAVYGNPEYLPLDEAHPVVPVNYYGYTKLVVEEHLQWLSKLNQVNYASLRYFNAVGYDIDGQIKGKEINPANLLPIVMETACGERPSMKIFGNDFDTPDGFGVRDYIHVNDLVDGHIKGMEYLLANKNDINVNLGTGQGYSVLEIVQACEKYTGKKLNYEIVGRRPGDPATVYADCTLAKKLLNWQARYSDLKTIIETTAAVYF